MNTLVVVQLQRWLHSFKILLLLLCANLVLTDQRHNVNIGHELVKRIQVVFSLLAIDLEEVLKQTKKNSVTEKFLRVTFFECEIFLVKYFCLLWQPTKIKHTKRFIVDKYLCI